MHYHTIIIRPCDFFNWKIQVLKRYIYGTTLKTLETLDENISEDAIALN